MFRKKAPRGTYPFSVMPLLRNLMGTLLGCILLGLPVMNARADFPDKPITVIVPFAAGGGSIKINLWSTSLRTRGKGFAVKFG